MFFALPPPSKKKNVFVYVYAVEPHIKPVRTKRDAYYSGKFTMVGDTPKTCFCNQNCEERKLADMFIIPQMYWTRVDALNKFVDKYAF